MSAVVSTTGANGPDFYPVSAPGSPERSTSLLPTPNAPPIVGSDPLCQILMTMQRLSDSSLETTSLRIQRAKDEMAQNMEALLDKIRELGEQLRKAKEDDGGGFFGDLLGKIGSVIGKIVGTITDFQVDVLMVPLEMGIDVASNLNDTQAMTAALQTSGMKLVENGATAEDIEGFSRGVAAFTGDLIQYSAELPLQTVEATIRGQNLLQSTKGELGKVLSSLKRNILDNPHFWAVANAAAKAAALTAAAASGGGALVLVAAVLLVAVEADKRTGYLSKLSEKAAPWIRLGMELGAAACVGFAGAGSDASACAKYLQVGASVVQGGTSAYLGARTIRDGLEQAERLEAQADLQRTINQMQQLQRLLDGLIDSFKEHSQNRDKTQELGAGLLDTQGKTQAASIAPA